MLSPTMKERIDDATEYKYMEVHCQLIGFSRSENPKDVSLTYIRNVFNLSDKTSPTKVRDGSLGQMAVLGLWEADYDGLTSNIRAGATARSFTIEYSPSSAALPEDVERWGFFDCQFCSSRGPY